MVPNSYAVKVPPKLHYEEEDPLPHTHTGLKCWCAAAIARGTPSAGNVIVDGTDSVTQESC